MADVESVLAVRDLTVEFKTEAGVLRALNGVGLEVPPDRTVGIVGESGCGKSTLINAILRLLPANSKIQADSRLTFQGRNLLTLDEPALRTLRGQGIAIVFQDPMTALNPVMSIGTQMIDIQHRQKVPLAEKRRRAVAMLEEVGIPDASARLTNYPHQFSGGMRQRICIAMAMMVHPTLLIADEPTTALDVTLEAQIIQLLRSQRERLRCSMLFVSHNLGLIAELCDEVVVMYAGEVIEKGTVEDIFHRARHPYTQLLLQCDPARVKEPRRKLLTISGSLPSLIQRPQGCIFAARCPQRIEGCTTARPERTSLSPSHEVFCVRT